MTVQDQAVLAAEAAVFEARAEGLLRRYGVMALAMDTARQQRVAASERLLDADISGEPRGISIAHAALVAAMDVHRATEAESERVRRALEAALDSLARTRRENLVSVACRACDIGRPGAASAAAPDPGFPSASPGGGRLEVVRRVLRQAGRVVARHARGPRQV